MLLFGWARNPNDRTAALELAGFPRFIFLNTEAGARGKQGETQNPERKEQREGIRGNTFRESQYEPS